MKEGPTENVVLGVLRLTAAFFLFRFLSFLGMEIPCVLLLTILGVDVASKSSERLVGTAHCVILAAS